MITIDNFPKHELVSICEGADDTADLMQRMIDQHPEGNYKSIPDRVDAIASAWADYMNGFWDEDNDVDEEEHWSQNYDWGETILEEMYDYVEDTNA